MTKQQIASLQTGDLVTIEFGGHAVTAEIVEDRGRLGPKGTKLFHVEIPTEDTEPIRLQLSEDELDEYRPATPLSKDEIIQYLVHGGLVHMLRHGSFRVPPRFWLHRNNVGAVAATVTSRKRSEEVGGAQVPFVSLNRGKVRLDESKDVIDFIQSFGLSRKEAEEVANRVGRYP